MMREVLGACAKVLGGEPGLAAHLRRNLLARTGLGGRSLPLDVGDRDDVPWQIRRAVQLRDGGRCQWPGGCDQPAYTCEPHHLLPRACHGPTAVCNLLTLCWLCRYRHNQHYADLGIMPMPGGPALVGGGCACRGARHNQRLSRKARSGSGGR